MFLAKDSIFSLIAIFVSKLSSVFVFYSAVDCNYDDVDDIISE